MLAPTVADVRPSVPRSRQGRRAMTDPEARVRDLLDQLADAIVELAAETKAPAPDPKLVSIDEAAAMLGIRRTAFYGLMNRGSVRTHKLGRRRLVSVASLHELADPTDAAADSAGPSRRRRQPVRTTKAGADDQQPAPAGELADAPRQPRPAA
jgi:excisionase family DNA binding protein